MPKTRATPSSPLNRAATMPMDTYHPGTVIEAVNALQVIGKQEALRRIDSYLAKRDKREPVQGLFWVLRVLFLMPAGKPFPPVRIGRPVIPPPADLQKLPRFPIVIAQDVPLLAVDRYVLGGKAEPVEAHVAYYRAHGALREAPLAPPEELDGIENTFLQEWRAAYGEAHVPEVLETVRAQMARMRA